MEFSYDWICQYVDPGTDPGEVARRLTAAGLAVEGQEPSGDDVIFDVDVTTNRPDCMNHFGLAREVATLLDRQLTAPEIEMATLPETPSQAARVEVEDQPGCPRYVARVVKGVKVAPSPAWLRQRLESIGQRPINNIVDITNFVLWELGQPIHAFDLHQLSAATIVVRRARDGERLTTLDGEGRNLNSQVLVIADAERAVALAGIMGGLESEVTAGTVDILIESAHFDPTRVRLGAGQLGLHTDASHRFERGADPEVCLRAADRVAALVREIAGGEILDEIIDVRDPAMDWRLQGTLELERVERFGGIELEKNQVERWMRGAGFELEPLSGDAWKVSVPPWRYYDLRPDPAKSIVEPQPEVFEADLFEEVLRLHGFEDIPSTLPHVGGPDAGTSAEHWRRQGIRQHLAASGYLEAVTFSFHDTESAARYPAIADQGEILRLANPISELYSVMQRSLLPGLVAAAQFNQRRGANAVRLFEIGHLFPGGESPEIEAVAIVAGGGTGSPWNRHVEYDLFDLKGAIQSLADHYGVELVYRPTELTGIVAGTGAQILTVGESPEVLGFIGQLDHDELPLSLFAAEMRTVLLVTSEVSKVELPSRFPAVEVDLTLTQGLEIAWEDLRREIESAQVPDLIAFGLKDRYRGEGVPAGAVNTTIYFLYNAADRSLTQTEVNERHEAVRQRLEDRFGWKGSM